MESSNELEYLNGWTKESVIEHVKKEFKGFSSDEAGCTYLNEDGLKCIAGCFIPAEKYNGRFESKAIDQLMTDGRFKSYNISTLMPFNAIAMSRWQSIHDDKIDPLTPLNEQLDKLINFLN